MKFKQLNSLLKEILKNRFFLNKKKLLYIVEDQDWSINWDGKYVTNGLMDNHLLEADVSKTAFGLRNKIVHFGSISTAFTKNKLLVHRSNKVVVTWFHVLEGDFRIPLLKKNLSKVDFIQTSNQITQQTLIATGIDQEKIVVVPLGVDLETFYPTTVLVKQQIRNMLQIPDGHYLIGSFQKDGNGWGKGLTPKYIKGPDIFVKVVAELAKNLPIHVLLTGPARGYVIKELTKRDIGFTHVFLKNYQEIVKYYQALDLYLVTSRNEGGPKAVLEAIATGIPLVSTAVGMAPEVIINGYNGFVVSNYDLLAEKAYKVLKDTNLANKIITNGLETVQNYSWNNVANQLYNKIYKRLL